MIVGVPKETCPGETRVALVPAALAPLTTKGVQILVESGAGTAAGYPDEAYQAKGATLAASREELFRSAEVILQVRGVGTNPDTGRNDLELMRAGQVVIAFQDPLGAPEGAKSMANRGVTAFAMELMPRISRAQSMDALSSMATAAGYAAVLQAATHLPKMFPMLMTAAGTITPARVMVLGAGVAGLQAIATARRLGAVVTAFDIRPAVKEQVQSLGAKFLEMELEAAGAEDKGGYATAQGEEFYRRQREMMAKEIAASDVVVTTAAVPGKKAPILITADMVAAMAPGSVIADLAAERGGNCELTRPGETAVEHGVTILGPTNLPATVPFHSSQMYAKNITTFFQTLVKDGKLELNMEDEVVRETLIARDGEVVHPRVRDALGMSPAGTAGEKVR